MGAVDFSDMNYDERPYDKWQAYGQAKSAQSPLPGEVDRREKGNVIRSCAIHAGGIFTQLQRHLSNVEMAKFGWTDADGNPSAAAEKLVKSRLQG